MLNPLSGRLEGYSPYSICIKKKTELCTRERRGGVQVTGKVLANDL